MRHNSPIHELDSLIAQAQDAQRELGALIEGITPDEHGVVTATLEDAAARAEQYRVDLVMFEEHGLAVAATIDDLHPQTNGSFDQLTALTRRIRGRLDRGSVGHADGALSSVDEGETASVAVEVTPAEEDGSGPEFYGV